MTTKNSPMEPAEAELREHALGFPEANEEFPWEHRALKVRSKIFLIMSFDDGVLGLTVKLPLSAKMALTLPFATPTGYGLGKSGWVTARFAPKVQVPIDMMKEWIDESYRAVAPRRLVARLDAPVDAGFGLFDGPPAVRKRSRRPKQKQK
jgi:predicted DNA-binding protein (MmcQ/YjbR family)